MEPSNQSKIIESITLEEIENPGKSKSIKYLQYISIVLSVLFSIAGIVFFLTWGKDIFSYMNSDEVSKENFTVFSWWIELWNFIWSKETRRKVNYKEANDFCYNLEPVWIWRIPKSRERAQTHADIQNNRIPNTILTDSWWYVEDMGASVPFYFNSKTHTAQNTITTERVIAWEDVIVKCITERYKIHPNDYGRFPRCKNENIVLSNWQIWAACNLWATEQWDRISIPKKCETGPRNCNSDLNWMWDFFQFWSFSSKDFTSYTETTQKYGEHGFYNPLTWAWDNEKNDYPLGACPAGWHIPTFEEWKLAYDVAWNNILDLRLALRLPVTGFREWISGHFATYISATGVTDERYNLLMGYTAYWSSTSVKEDGEWLHKWDIIMLNFWDSTDSPYAPRFISWRWYNGYAIRCLANK